MSDPKNVLVICGRNKRRSPTAAKVYAKLPGMTVHSAGLSASSPHVLKESDIRWADIILVMERRQASRIRSDFSHLDLPPLHCLEIPDDYDFMDPELVEILESSTEDWLGL